MRKLITANFHRFIKDRFSWCVMGIIVILSLVNVFNSARSYEAMAASGYVMSLDDYYFNQAPLIGAFLALLISMFLGTEFSEGTIRNKLCIGHKRNEIFLSNFISCAFASIVLTAVWLLSSALLFGLIGPLEMGVSEFIGCIFVAVGFAVSFAALYTVIGSLSSNKPMTIIYTFAVFIIFAMAASALYDRLCEPEMNEQAKVKKDYVATAGAMQMTAVNENFDLVIGNTPFQLNENAHRQLGLQLKIPAPYYERMRAENPGLLMANVNGWFQQSPDTRRMVRIC